MLLVEKYRPKSVDEIVGLTTKIPIDETIPHLFLYGPAGTGKTSFAKVVIRTLGCDHLILNASDERGIDVVRDKVKSFASTQSTNRGIKIILLDEADALTPDAQTALRNTIEKYSGNCRFIFTANYQSKVIDPIKSRCTSIEFDHIPRKAIVDRLEYICKQEKIPYERVALEKIVEGNNSDMRRSINRLEELRDGVTLDKIKDEVRLAEDIFELIKSKEFNKARDILLSSCAEPEQFMKDLYHVIYNSEESSEYKQCAIVEIADTYRWLPQVAWKEIQVEALVLKLMRD